MARRGTDIWAWVRDRSRDLRAAGQGHVADLIWAIPRDENEKRVERVRAVMPEALAAARALEDPWLEVFFRHWGMQNRVNHLLEGSSAIPDATANLEFAHREETMACPQSVCTTQDMAIAYGNSDGPGYSPERLAVVAETLQRIDPTWQCFLCLSIEYSNALEGEERWDEAIAFMAAQADALARAGEKPDGRFLWHQARILAEAGRFAEALKRYDEVAAMEDDPEADDDRIERSIDRALVLIGLGRREEAKGLLPVLEDLTPGDYHNWTDATTRLALAMPDLNTWQLGTAFQTAVDHLVRVGAHRYALDVALRHGELAVARGAREPASRALQAAQDLVPKLHRPLDAPARVASLAALVAAMPEAAPLPVPADELLAHLRETEEPDLEKSLEWLLAASRQRPDDVELHVTTARVMVDLGLADRAADFLLAHLDRHPTDRILVNGILNVAAASSRVDVYAPLLAAVEPLDARLGHWVRGIRAANQDDWPEAIAQAEAILADDPDDSEALYMAAGSAFQTRDYASATKRWMRTLELEGDKLEPGRGWHLLAAASASQNWEVVRHVAGLMGMELTGSGVVEESWEACVIVFGEAGREKRYVAQRTGPVTARVLEPAAPDDQQHAGDWIVFDARPVDPPPEDEEERRKFWYTYRLIHVIEPGGFGHSWLLDGAESGKHAWPKLRDELRGRGWSCWNVTGDGYHVNDPEGDRKWLSGILIFVAVPETTPLTELHDALTELTASWRHPLSWLQLATAVGKGEKRHQKIVKRYGL